MGGNLIQNTVGGFIVIGNSTVNSTVNSTIFSGISNNSLNLGGSLASAYELHSSLTTDVAVLTANNTSFVGTISAANVVSNAQLSQVILALICKLLAGLSYVMLQA